ncbi:unnamed protein product [Ascophyllum nodosum]
MSGSLFDTVPSGLEVGRYELRPGGANADVTASDLGEWVDEVTRVFLVDSVATQVGALVKVRWTCQPWSHRRKATQDFSSTFLRDFGGDRPFKAFLAHGRGAPTALGREGGGRCRR